MHSSFVLTVTSWGSQTAEITHTWMNFSRELIQAIGGDGKLRGGPTRPSEKIALVTFEFGFCYLPLLSGRIRSRSTTRCLRGYGSYIWL